MFRVRLMIGSGAYLGGVVPVLLRYEEKLGALTSFI